MNQQCKLHNRHLLPMKYELKLTNKDFAETIVASLTESKATASLAEVDGKFVVTYEITAASPAPSSDNSGTQPMSSDDTHKKIGQAVDYVCARINDVQNSMYRHVDNLYSAQAAHQKGHLPPLTPSGMNKLIKAAGQDGDYQAKPVSVYASKMGAIEFNATELKGALERLHEKDEVAADADVSRLLKVLREQKK